jgi:hypothetical protein
MEAVEDNIVSAPLRTEASTREVCAYDL